MRRRTPRDYHDLEAPSEPYQQLRSVRDIISSLMDDIYTAQQQETPLSNYHDQQENDDIDY